MEAIKRGPGRPSNESRAKRTTRVPLGAPRLKLTVPEKSDKVQRWVNDIDSRLDDAMEGGYTFAPRIDNVGIKDVEPGNTDPGSRTSRKVGVKDDGDPLNAYLMEIDREDYETDQASKDSRMREVESAIRSGNLDGQASDGRYIPAEGIKLRS